MWELQPNSQNAEVRHITTDKVRRASGEHHNNDHHEESTTRMNKKSTSTSTTIERANVKSIRTKLGLKWRIEDESLENKLSQRGVRWQVGVRRQNGTQ